MGMCSEENGRSATLLSTYTTTWDVEIAEAAATASRTDAREMVDVAQVDVTV
jgi:hypothetical protein